MLRYFITNNTLYTKRKSQQDTASHMKALHPRRCSDVGPKRPLSGDIARGPRTIDDPHAQHAPPLVRQGSGGGVLSIGVLKWRRGLGSWWQRFEGRAVYAGTYKARCEVISCFGVSEERLRREHNNVFYTPVSPELSKIYTLGTYV